MTLPDTPGDGLDPVAEAITEHWGERCLDFDEDCFVCQAWKQYDDLRSPSVIGDTAGLPSDLAALVERLRERKLLVTDYDHNGFWYSKSEPDADCVAAAEAIAALSSVPEAVAAGEFTIQEPVGGMYGSYTPISVGCSTATPPAPQPIGTCLLDGQLPWPDLLAERDRFIVDKGLWTEFVASLIDRPKAGSDQ